MIPADRGIPRLVARGLSVTSSTTFQEELQKLIVSFRQLDIKERYLRVCRSSWSDTRGLRTGSVSMLTDGAKDVGEYAESEYGVEIRL